MKTDGAGAGRNVRKKVKRRESPVLSQRWLYPVLGDPGAERAVVRGGGHGGASSIHTHPRAFLTDGRTWPGAREQYQRPREGSPRGMVLGTLFPIVCKR